MNGNSLLMGNNKLLRICINARLIGGVSGGIEQFVIGLAHGLSSLHVGNEEYHFYSYVNANDWLSPYINKPCSLLCGDITLQRPVFRDDVRLSGRLLLSKLFGQLIARYQQRKIPPALKVEKQNKIINDYQVIHFPYQSGVKTSIPNIYHPWDLQHLHLPDLFSETEIQSRDYLYQFFCNQASRVCTTTNWGKNDLLSRYKIQAEKIIVVPSAPVVEAYPSPTEEEINSVKRKLQLPESFIYFPANTWAHKNHLNLLRALCLLRDCYGIEVPLVCTGRKTGFYSQIQQFIHQNGLENQVSFLDFLSSNEIQCVYQLARMVIYPTLFEGGGLPVLEAFYHKTPLACANVTMLPEIAENSAVYFDPENIEDIAHAVKLLWQDDGLRKEMVQRGTLTVSKYSWKQTAKYFRAVYRELSGAGLTEEDLNYLSTISL